MSSFIIYFGVCVNIVLADNRKLAVVLNCWIGNLQTCAIFHWSPLIYFVWKAYMCACNSFILRAWIFQSICYGGFEEGRGGASCWGREASIENHQYLCIVFLHMHLLFRLMPMLSVGAHLVSWCGWPAVLWWREEGFRTRPELWLTPKRPSRQTGHVLSTAHLSIALHCTARSICIIDSSLQQRENVWFCAKWKNWGSHRLFGCLVHVLGVQQSSQ